MNDCYSEMLLVDTDKLEDDELFLSRVVGEDYDLIQIDSLLRMVFSK